MEDRQVNRDMLVEFLRRMGIAADSAADGRQALDMVQQHDYDVVLMDIQMPRMDGLTACRAIRNLGRPRLNKLPVLAMTARASQRDREHTLAAGMNDHLIKPIKRTELAKALAKWLPDLNRPASAADTPSTEPAPVTNALADGDPDMLQRQLTRMRRALVNDEPWPCKKILTELLGFRWAADTQAVLQSIQQQINHYQLAGALTILDKHVNAASDTAQE